MSVGAGGVVSTASVSAPVSSDSVIGGAGVGSVSPVSASICERMSSASDLVRLSQPVQVRARTDRSSARTKNPVAVRFIRPFASFHLEHIVADGTEIRLVESLHGVDEVRGILGSRRLIRGVHGELRQTNVNGVERDLRV